MCAFHFTVWMGMSGQVMLRLLGFGLNRADLTPTFTGIQTKSGTQALPKRLIHTRTWLDDEPLDFDGLESEVLWVDYARGRDVNYCGQMVHWKELQHLPFHVFFLKCLVGVSCSCPLIGRFVQKWCYQLLSLGHQQRAMQLFMRLLKLMPEP